MRTGLQLIIAVLITINSLNAQYTLFAASSSNSYESGLVNHNQGQGMYIENAEEGLLSQVSHFSAYEMGDGHVYLDLVTLAYAENFVVEVEYSQNSIEFQSIGKMDINTTKQEYNLLHKKPTKGSNYYRLKIADKEGNVVYSKTQLVVFEVWGKIRVYPNTVNELTELELEMPLFENSQIAVTDNLGNVVAETVLLAGRRNVHVDLSSLESGEYVVQLQTSADNRQFSLVITN
ncbi:MAG: T9SS type A sorting domain-containing protein [Aureispira sp.]|nr:T9SS type A sorting domain-containing protein [Aureispira sp.]